MTRLMIRGARRDAREEVRRDTRDEPPSQDPPRSDDGRGCGSMPGSSSSDGGPPTFALVRKGYDPMQVDQHLAWLAAAPAPGVDNAYLEADRIIADARRLAAEVRFEAARCERQAEAILHRARKAAEQADAELDAARAEAARILADARTKAAEVSACHEVA